MLSRGLFLFSELSRIWPKCDWKVSGIFWGRVNCYFRSTTGVITMSQYPITGCIKVLNRSISSVSTNMKWLCWGAFIPPLMYVTPISWHRAPQSVTVGVGEPSAASGLRWTPQLSGVWWLEMWKSIVSSNRKRWQDYTPVRFNHQTQNSRLQV